MYLHYTDCLKGVKCVHLKSGHASIYPLTARENIWFGDVSRPCDKDGVEVAARAAGADEGPFALFYGRPRSSLRACGRARAKRLIAPASRTRYQ